MAHNPAKAQARERLAGLLLIGAALLAVIAANSPLEPAYRAFLHFRFGPALPRLGVLDLDHWISEGLMTLFFLLVGLEVKREWYEGRLASPSERRLPIIAAVGGMAAPALIYLAAVGYDPAHVQGWAVPAATDIAFAIGVLALLGSRVPASIKLLLVTIAVVDDIGAVAIIALVYTSDLSVIALGAALALTLAMALMNLLGVGRVWPYMIAFALLWLLVLASGVHATIAGVLAALTIPLGGKGTRSPLKSLEHRIHPAVMLAVVPLFGFTSAGVPLGGGFAALGAPVALGVLLGLFVGKPIGVLGALWATVRLGLAAKPRGATWTQLWGAGILCGIGFTMSLFIGALAFPGDEQGVEAARLGTVAGSLLSALAGWAVLRFVEPVLSSEEDSQEALEIFGEDQPD
jgi:NhaA family Na+:H+ antiporter